MLASGCGLSWSWAHDARQSRSFWLAMQSIWFRTEHICEIYPVSWPNTSVHALPRIWITRLLVCRSKNEFQTVPPFPVGVGGHLTALDWSPWVVCRRSWKVDSWASKVHPHRLWRRRRGRRKMTCRGGDSNYVGGLPLVARHAIALCHTNLSRKRAWLMQLQWGLVLRPTGQYGGTLPAQFHFEWWYANS